MSMLRTQVYLTREQRRRLDERGRRDGRAIAELVREAVDRYLSEPLDAEAALDRTFGAFPDLEVPPRGEWDRG